MLVILFDTLTNNNIRIKQKKGKILCLSLQQKRKI